VNFADTVRYLYSLGHELKAGKWDLANMRALLARMGHPEGSGRFIHVAGTNGKGSVCAMLASALQVSGVRTGLYTSPHLVNPRERIQIDGRWISEAAWCAAFDEVHGVAESLLAREAIPAHPSFFETVTAMAFSAFARAGVEMVVLETGLGGRLDATNVVMPEFAVITPIDFDHEAFLGSSIQSIAAEKAGILKTGRPAVFSGQRPDALRVLDHRALELDIPVHHSSEWRLENLQADRYGSRFTLVADESMEIVCPLAGLHQVENARTAAAALSVAGVPRTAIQRGIAQAVWPGRLERVALDPDVILDGAHNPAGARALAAYISAFFHDEPVRIIFGAMRDKAIDEVTETLFPLAAEIIITAPDQPRALSPQALAETWGNPKWVNAKGVDAKTAARLPEALVMAAQQPMTTFITGSLYLVGEARAIYGTQALRRHLG
jgi:dihydrofolate synthase/folylpolyglutamate synthase